MGLGLRDHAEKEEVSGAARANAAIYRPAGSHANGSATFSTEFQHAWFVIKTFFLFFRPVISLPQMALISTSCVLFFWFALVLASRGATNGKLD